MTVYADAEDLTAYLGAAHTAPVDEDEVTRLLTRASELVDAATRGRARLAYDGELSFGGQIPVDNALLGWTQEQYQAALVKAVCAQIEFWLEFGEEHDIVGLTGSASLGRVAYSRLPSRLGTRVTDILLQAGLLSGKAWII